MWSALTPTGMFADTGHAEDEPTLFGILYLGGFVLAAVVALVIILWLQRGDRNPATGLPRPIRRRRARGTMMKHRRR
jgi:hypothetical protein